MTVAAGAVAVAANVLARSGTGEGVKSGPIGLAVILLLCVAAYFLFKSMSRHMKKVREDFPRQDEPPRRTGTPGTVRTNVVQPTPDGSREVPGPASRSGDEADPRPADS